MVAEFWSDFRSLMYILLFTAIHAILFLIHFISHTVAELLDPADPELRALDSKKPVPEFDRNKHAHVIENGRCHLCNITISSQRTKHCSGLFKIGVWGCAFNKLEQQHFESLTDKYSISRKIFLNKSSDLLTWWDSSIRFHKTGPIMPLLKVVYPDFILVKEPHFTQY